MKTKLLKNYDPLKVKLTAYEQSIEDAIDENAIPDTDPAMLAEVREAAARALAKIRGGKRAGAGRKSREYVKTTVLLAPAVRTRLELLAKESGSLSAAIEKAIMTAHH